MTANLIVGTNAAMLSASIIVDGANGGNLWAGSSIPYWHDSMAALYEHSRLYITLAEGQSVNFLAIARADMLVKSAASAAITAIYGAGDTEWLDSGTLTTDELVGPSAKDYVHLGAEITNSDWTIEISYTSLVAIPYMSKLLFGKAIDPVRDPTRFQMQRTRLWQAQHFPQYQIQIAWEKLSYAVAMQFKEQVADNASHAPICLMTVANHNRIMHGYKVLWCEVLDIDIPQQVTGYNDITMTVRELI